MIVLWNKLFIQKYFSKNGMAMRNPKNNSEKRVGKGQVVQPNGTSWDKLEYVGRVGQGEGGLQILVGQVGQGEGYLQIFVGQVGQRQGVCPLEPFHLSQMGIQGREVQFRSPTISFFRPTQSIIHVPLQVNWFQKIILLIVLYKYLKSFPRRFYSPEFDPLHKIMRYDVYYSTQLSYWFRSDRNLSDGNDLYWRWTSFEKAFRRGRPLNILHDS